MLDLVCALVLAGIAATVLGVYLVRVALVGRVRPGRLATVSSVMLGQSVMEMAYWGLEPVVRLLLRVGATPNIITLASLVPAALAGVAVAGGHLGVGALLATVAASGDMLDGIVARRRALSSDAGEVVDAAADRYVEFFLLAGMAVHYRQTLAIELLALGAILGSFMVSYATAKAEALGIEPPKGAMRRAERGVYLLVGTLLTPIVGAIPGVAGESVWLRDFPLLLALAMVAVVANISAVRRLHRTAVLVQAREIRQREHTSAKVAAGGAGTPGARL